jgi:2-keto-4-pentenoate hydratase/2-oxohepta-3-ene-1,7-dioic acid hydratase in catechol pathway
MYLASFRYRDRDALGARVSDSHLIDLAEAAKAYGDGMAAAAAFSDMHAFIEAGPTAQRQAEQLLAAYRNAPDKVAAISLTEISWHPPVRRPGKICCIALNNSASDSRRISGPNHPMFFLKPRSCLVGHEQDIVVRPHYGGLHPEPELAVVLGRTAKDLDPRSALDAVFGYSIINDITGNEMRAQDRVHYYALYASKENPDQVERREQHLSYTARYKGSDTFGPMGPWLATRDEVSDPHALDVTCSVAGVLLAEDSTRYLTYSVSEVLAYISRYHTLEPGDVIAMGTAFRPSAQSRRSLHTGDLSRMDGPVEVTITGLGTLRNGVRRVVDDPGDWRLPKA